MCLLGKCTPGLGISRCGEERRPSHPTHHSSEVGVCFCSGCGNRKVGIGFGVGFYFFFLGLGSVCLSWVGLGA
jgi:hypothetical protein